MFNETKTSTIFRERLRTLNYYDDADISIEEQKVIMPKLINYSKMHQNGGIRTDARIL